MELLHDAEFWTGLALLVFLALMLGMGVHKTAAKALDSKAAERQAVEEAKLNERLASAEAEIRAARDQAMGNVSAIAVETARASASSAAAAVACASASSFKRRASAMSPAILPSRWSMARPTLGSSTFDSTR